jgi:hypothetical protein
VCVCVCVCVCALSGTRITFHTVCLRVGAYGVFSFLFLFFLGQFCGKNFSRKDALKQHERVHTKEGEEGEGDPGDDDEEDDDDDGQSDT